MKKILSIGLVFCFLILLCASFGACSKKETVKKVKDLEFTVVPDSELPEKLANAINDRKMNPFRLKYDNKENLYIVQGFGAQKSSGYDIKVEELYLAENAIYIKNTLVGPDKNDPVTETITFPYVVVKIEYMDKEIIFE